MIGSGGRRGVSFVMQICSCLRWIPAIDDGVFHYLMRPMVLISFI